MGREREEQYRKQGLKSTELLIGWPTCDKRVIYVPFHHPTNLGPEIVLTLKCSFKCLGSQPYLTTYLWFPCPKKRTRRFYSPNNSIDFLREPHDLSKKGEK